MPHLAVTLCAQTFNRMLHLKLANPRKYSWVIPVSGDFHYQFHFASGIHRISYLPFLKWFVDVAGMEKTIPKNNMDDTKYIKYIDQFYQLVIKSILTYLTDVYGHEYMSKKASEILEEQKANNGERVLLGPHCLVVVLVVEVAQREVLSCEFSSSYPKVVGCLPL